MNKLYKLLCLILAVTLFYNPKLYAQGGSCSAAVNIASLPYSSGATSLTTCFNTNIYTSAMACGNAYMNGYDYVFKYTPATALNACVSITLGGTASNRGLFVTKGCPNAPGASCIAEAIDMSPTQAKITGLQLTVGQTYYIIVSSQYYCASFSLTITNAGVCTAPSTGSSCSLATVVTALPYSDASTTCGKGSGYNAGNTCTSAYLNGEDAVYSFTTGSSYTCISISVTGAAAYSGVFIMDGCPDLPGSKCINSQTSTAAATFTLPYVGLKANKTYYIIISTNGASVPCTPYTLNITNVSCGPPGSYCGNPYIINSNSFNQTAKTTCGFYKNYTNNMGCTSSNMGGEDFVYSYTPATNVCVVLNMSNTSGYSLGMYIMDGCADDPTTNCVAKTESYYGPLSLSANLTAGVTYYYYLTTYSGCTSFDFNMMSIPLGAAGETCSNPYVINSLPLNLTNLSTACKGNDYTSANACSSTFMNGQDFVFSYTPPTNQTVRIQTNNTKPYTGLFVLDKCPNAAGAVCVASSTPSWGANNPSLCSASLTGGVTYYIIIDTDPTGWGAADYTNFDFKMSVSPIGTTCANPYPVPGLPFSVTGLNTACMGNDYTPSDACQSYYMGADDFVFEYTPNTSDCITITANNATYYSGLFLIQGCPNSPSSNCVQQTNNSWNGGTMSLTGSVQAGQTYYIIVDNSYYSTAFDLSITTASATAPTCNFTSDQQIICVGDLIKFSDTSVPCVTGWSWSFPGGSPSTSNAQFPVVSYLTKGKYNVSLTVTNMAGSSTVSKSLYITAK